MKPVYQSIFDDTLKGDCFRACIASIFEFSIEEMPNFWEQTQDASEFWKLNNQWLIENRQCKCLNIHLLPYDKHVVADILCIACAKSPRGNRDHAVVWQNGLIHDPHPSGAGLAEDPDTFSIFVPLDPGNEIDFSTKKKQKRR